MPDNCPIRSRSMLACKSYVFIKSWKYKAHQNKAKRNHRFTWNKLYHKSDLLLNLVQIFYYIYLNVYTYTYFMDGHAKDIKD